MKQVRFIPIEDCGLQIRETEFGQGKSRTVVGRPVMFGVRSVNLTPWSDTRVVYEILEPNCITQELINRSNVVYNNNHSNDIDIHKILIYLVSLIFLISLISLIS